MAVNRNRILKAVDKYTRQGKLEAAVTELLKLTKDNPRDMATVNRVGDLYARMGKTKQAVAQFSKIADCYTQEGFLLKAIAIYKKISKLDPTSLNAYHNLARLYSQQGLTMEARAQFQVVAEQQVREGADKAALATFREMLELDPHDLKVRLTIAELLERTGDSDGALTSYREIGTELDRRSMFAESRKVYEAALRLAPGENGLLRSLIICLRRQEASGEALQYLSGLLEERPDDVGLLSLVGDAHLDTGDLEQARQMYEQARKLGPDQPENHLNESRLVLQEGDADAAFEHIAKVAKGNPGTENLIPYLLELLDVRPHHIGALRCLASVHESAGQESLARDACIRLAGACMEQGKLPETAATLERLIRMDPGNARHQERLQDVVARIKQEGGSYSPGDTDTGESAPLGETAATTPGVDPPTAPDPSAQETAGSPTPAEAPETTEDAEEGVEVPADIEVVLPPAEEAVDADFIAEHMTEAEVFVKYGLVDRAVDQLRQILETYPNYLAAHEALLGIHREEGNRTAAAIDYGNIARIQESRGALSDAEETRRQAAEFSPAETPARETAVGAPSTPPAQEEPVSPPVAQAAAGAAEASPGAPVLEEPGPSSEPVAQPEPSVEADAPVQGVAEFEEEAEEEGAEIDLDAIQEAETLPAGELEDVDALIEGGALEEARRRLVTLRGRFPDRAELEERLTRIGLLESSAQPATRPAPAPAPAGDSDDFFDLAAELDESLFEPQMAVDEEPEAEGHSLEDLVEAFKKGVEQEVDSEDFETHYNLAIAYKEMGLVDEAIGEFQFASKSPDFFLKCCSMLGVCFREKGMMALAVKWYTKGLERPEGDEEELLGLRYDLAALLQETGEGARAMELFTEVYGANAKYRDVADRLSALRESASGG